MSKARGLDNAGDGSPSSYCHALLVVFFLTHTQAQVQAMIAREAGSPDCVVGLDSKPFTAPVLPNLQLLPRPAAAAGSEPWMVDGFDTWFCEDVEEAKRSLLLPRQQAVGAPAAAQATEVVPDQRGVPELLLGYFEWLQWLLQPENVQRR